MNQRQARVAGSEVTAFLSGATMLKVSLEEAVILTLSVRMPVAHNQQSRESISFLKARRTQTLKHP